MENKTHSDSFSDSKSEFGEYFSNPESQQANTLPVNSQCIEFIKDTSYLSENSNFFLKTSDLDLENPFLDSITTDFSQETLPNYVKFTENVTISLDIFSADPTSKEASPISQSCPNPAKHDFEGKMSNFHNKHKDFYIKNQRKSYRCLSSGFSILLFNKRKDQLITVVLRMFIKLLKYCNKGIAKKSIKNYYNQNKHFSEEFPKFKKFFFENQRVLNEQCRISIRSKQRKFDQKSLEYFFQSETVISCFKIYIDIIFKDDSAEISKVFSLSLGDFESNNSELWEIRKEYLKDLLFLSKK